MSNHLVFLVFLTLVIILLCQATPILTPQQHAELEGDEFCNRGKKTLKKICVKVATNRLIKKYQKAALDNLSCTEGDRGKVLLDPGDGGAWELVQDALLECIFEVPPDQLHRLPYSVTKTFGRGTNKFDAFEYRWDDQQSRYVAAGLQVDLLKGIIK